MPARGGTGHSKLDRALPVENENQLFKDYMHLVPSVARRTLSWGPHNQYYHDIISAGNLALLEAIRTYDSKSCKFVTFAMNIIGFRMVDAIRELLGRKEGQRAFNNTMMSLEYALDRDDEGSITLGDTLLDTRAEGMLDIVTNREHIKSLFAESHGVLSDRDADIFVRWVHGETLSDLGAEHDFTESRACQINSSVRRKLRTIAERQERYDSEQVA